MESVEVWMWVVAGMVLGGIVFLGAFKLLSNYMYSTEVSQAQDNVNLLYGMVNSVCFGGKGQRESKGLMLPYIVTKVYVQDEFGIEEQGKELCYALMDEDPFCLDLKACEVTMHTIESEKTKGVFYSMQKFLGKKKPQRFRFKVAKTDFDKVMVNWTEEV